MDLTVVMGIVGKSVLARGTSIAVGAASATYWKGKSKKEVERELRLRVERAWDAHLRFVSSWAEVHKPLDTPKPLSVETSTIPLDLTDMPRRYTTEGSSQRVLAEGDLLSLGLPLLLTGDPGAGKTTTVKRLCRRMMTQEPTDPADTACYPVLIECRSHDWSKVDLVDLLSDATGFPETDGDRLAAVASFLNETGAFVFVDGLDEVSYRPGMQDRRSRLEQHVRALAHHLGRGRVLVSCRSGSAPDLDNYQTLELCPLTNDQVARVAHARLGDASTAFLQQLSASPIHDIATRPLLLSQVIVVFERRGGKMPNRPALLYSKMVKLLLEEWDETRRVSRHSKYAAFGPEEKMQFLSELSFQLTVNGSIRFSTEDLAATYENVCEKWDLPPKEAVRVAREIETHNGLIVTSGDMYEFSHLSLQEYLCAEYMVKLLDHKRIGEYLDQYPEPVAVAVALASEPTAWLTQVVMRKGAFQRKRSVRAFVHRLGRERPAFGTHLDLGHAVLRLMYGMDDEDTSAFTELAGIAAVRRSVSEAVLQYDRRRAAAGVTLRYDGPKEAGRAYTPKNGTVPEALWKLMVPDDMQDGAGAT